MKIEPLLASVRVGLMLLAALVLVAAPVSHAQSSDVRAPENPPATQEPKNVPSRATWLISPDEGFIAINHHLGSGAGLLHVFSRD